MPFVCFTPAVEEFRHAKKALSYAGVIGIQSGTPRSEGPTLASMISVEPKVSTLIVETIAAKIRRAFFVQGEPIKKRSAVSWDLSRKVVRKVLRSIGDRVPLARGGRRNSLPKDRPLGATSSINCCWRTTGRRRVNA